jgi:hypothetical protein
LPRLHGPRPRFALPLVLFVLALAACSHGGSSPSVTPTLSAAPGVPSSNLAVTGAAYIPDGGNGSTHGIAVVHTIDLSGNFVAPSPASTPTFVVFPGSVGPFAVTSDALVAISADAVSGNGPPFVALQDVFGFSGALITPVFPQYLTTVAPTAAPSTSPTPTPSVSPVLSDVKSLAILESNGVPNSAIALSVGDTGILGVNALAFPPLSFAQFITFNDPSYTPTPPPPAGPRDNILITPDSLEALVRGPTDLIAFSITPSATGYTLNATSHDETLGTAGVGLRGHGAMAVDPSSDQFALVAQTTANANVVTLLSGLPTAMVKATSVPVTAPRSVAWEQGGTYAVVGADGGYYILTLNTGANPPTISPSVPVLMTPPPFTGCDGLPHKLTSVTSVAFDASILVLYGPTDATCASGANGAVEAFSFPVPGATPTATPTPAPSTTPAPSFFIQNNVIAPSASQSYPDYMVVR